MKKGFTLIELIITIGILAVLATVTIIVINPAQIFAQARDAQRIADLDVINKSIGYYLVGTTSADMDGAVSGAGACGANNFWSTFGATGTTSIGTVYQAIPAGSATTSVVGGGWVPVDFTQMLTGTSISALPIDPVNTSGVTGYAYSYGCDNVNKTFELNANLESTRYTVTDDFDGTDGGDSLTLYEVGNDPGLNL